MGSMIMSFCGSAQQLIGDSSVRRDIYDGGDNMNILNLENVVNKDGTVGAKDKNNVMDVLRAVPGSYNDFVNSTADCMSQDKELENLIMELIRTKPESNSSDVLKALCDFYGFNKPLEIVDDDDDFHVGAVETVSRAGSMVRVAY